MFSRGSRFPAAKASEVPGPGAYDPQDPEYDAYKRGAFLEATNRFNKDKPSDVPGPGAYDTEPPKGQNRPPTRTSNTTSTDRLAILQRKLEELERIHVEEKKTHHLEQERLKLELSRAQRTAAEQSERCDKLKKQNDALDSRVQELKKTSATEQAELRELRVKLRASEQERNQLAAKQGDAADARKVEARRKEEVRERDRKIAELEKALGMEKKKREAAEAKWQEAKSKTDGRVQEARAAAQDVENRLRAAEQDAKAAREALQELECLAQDTEENLVAQLEQHRTALSRVAEEYGRLASSTVALNTHERLKQEASALQLRSNRLERKLANSDAQVNELARLIRQVQEDNSFLAVELREARQQSDHYRAALNDNTLIMEGPSRDLEEVAAAVEDERRASELLLRESVCADLELWSTLDRAQKESLLYHSSVIIKELDDIGAQLDHRTKEVSAAEAARTHLCESLAQAQTERAEAQAQLAEAAASLAESNVRLETVKKELEAVRADAHAEVVKAEQMVQQEKQAKQRLAASLRQAQQAEQFLRSEVEQLSSDLAEADKYVEAYNGLVAEVDALVVKNALAEVEAQRLSKFNAEILGHNNPAQRIVYVDRIRRELHETKQKLLLSTRDREAVMADNDDLRAELDMYKSVAVPHDIKPRTTITRVTRLPTAPSEPDMGSSVSALRVSDQTQGPYNSRSTTRGSTLTSVPELPAPGDDMTLDEIM
ncbi:hypothetical protein L226DRAFT_481835 [Lentinus tigrinus ALCF2SS1-7]|uniref:Hyaluronan-mediated motility receptor C-terminal domain-containing protein n=1 Tax=Lentinus tigrinus ALCF2SS1-6 TaxID=1328759 RepID=A0A5C2S2B9_9APHY|nr:hypothetical protein L227DRAFT_530289 [Lentinus tigrinus ALCF2SS1-6]RPD78806.1 hypothetical protein L226DRAFT_481835 [Lentinus tigrinus ALCF2SS1-7]